MTAIAPVMMPPRVRYTPGTCQMWVVARCVGHATVVVVRQALMVPRCAVGAAVDFPVALPRGHRCLRLVSGCCWWCPTLGVVGLLEVVQQVAGAGGEAGAEPPAPWAAASSMVATAMIPWPQVGSTGWLAHASAWRRGGRLGDHEGAASSIPLGLCSAAAAWTRRAAHQRGPGVLGRAGRLGLAWRGSFRGCWWCRQWGWSRCAGAPGRWRGVGAG